MTDVEAPSFDPIRDISPQEKLQEIDKVLAIEGLTRQTASPEKIKSLTDLYELEATDLQDQYTLKREEGKILPRIKKVPQKSLMELIKGQEKQIPPAQTFGSSEELTELFTSKLRDEEARVRGEDTSIFEEEKEFDPTSVTPEIKPELTDKTSLENKQNIATDILDFMNKEVEIPEEVVSSVKNAFNYLFKELPKDSTDPAELRAKQFDAETAEELKSLINATTKVVSQVSDDAVKMFKEDILGKTDPKQIMDAASAALTGGKGQAVSSEMERIKQESAVNKIKQYVKASKPVINNLKNLSVDTLERVATVAELIGKDAFKTTKIYTDIISGKGQNILRNLNILEDQLTKEKSKAGPRPTPSDTSMKTEIIQEGDFEKEEPFIEQMKKGLKKAKQSKAGPRPVV